MKKLGKLSVNPEKVMKNEELVNLRGGYGTHNGVTCANYGNFENAVSYCIAPGEDPTQICSGYDIVITWESADC